MKKVFALILIVIAFIVGLYTYKYYFKDKEEQTTKSQEEKQVIEDIIDEIDTKYDKDVSDTKDKQEDTKEQKKEETEYDQYFVANGYSGASDNVYYTKNNVLYHLILSTNKKIKVAEGVEKLENDLGTIIVYKGKNFKILVEDNYLTYVD